MEKETKEFIDEIKKLHTNELDFNSLAKLIEEENINISFIKLSYNVAGFTYFNQIYINEKYYSVNKLFFIILHEIGHYKRLKKNTLEHFKKLHSRIFLEKDFDFIINEEIIADRYARFIYYKLNNFCPTYMTQDLYNEFDKNEYKKQLEFTFEYGDSNYLEHINKLKKLLLF